ncbi:MAG: DsrE family protein [Gammaproteobacteria bacterium]|jgi:uncharacterized protein
MYKRLIFIATLLLSCCAVNIAMAGKIKGVVVQANGSRAAFEHALKLAINMKSVLTDTKFEIVVFGPTVKLLTPLNNEEPLVQQVQGAGIKLLACGRSLKTDHVKKSDLDPGIPVVPFGAVHILERQADGWVYFKP